MKLTKYLLLSAILSISQQIKIVDSENILSASVDT